MVDPLTFRDAVLDDVVEVVALIESAYRGEGSRAGWTTEAELLDGQRTDPQEISGLIQGENSRIRLALRKGEVIACVRIDDIKSAGYIGMVSVRPNLQSGGVGRSVLLEAERIIRDDLHHAVARMTVIGQRDTLIAWYLRRGYALTGARESFPYGEPRSGLPRRDDLYFEVLEKTLQ
ncbi:MAG: GNAT family N-acetyltransferase [Phycisphaerales bacterium]|nr:GNAT family N-acetyltransferase [Phycisphaerales bacterium]